MNTIQRAAADDLLVPSRDDAIEDTAGNATTITLTESKPGKEVVIRKLGSDEWAMIQRESYDPITETTVPDAMAWRMVRDGLVDPVLDEDQCKRLHADVAMEIGANIGRLSRFPGFYNPVKPSGDAESPEDAAMRGFREPDGEPGGGDDSATGGAEAVDGAPVDAGDGVRVGAA